MVSVINWNPSTNMDFNTGEGVPPGSSFVSGDTSILVSFLFSESDPNEPNIGISIGFDPVQVNGDAALVRNRDGTGAELPPEDRTYLYLTNTSIRQLGAIQGQPGVRNIEFANGGPFVIGDGTTGTGDDDLGNLHDLRLSVGPAFVLSLGGPDSILGTDFGDRILTNTGNDVALGGNGNDSLYGGMDDDTVYGQVGNDLLFGDFGADSVVGGTGNDTAFGGQGNDTMDFGDGDNVGFGGKDNDFFPLASLTGINLAYGDDGDDVFDLNGGSGAASVWGGAGNDDFTAVGYLGALSLWGGAGNNFYELRDLAQGLFLRGGADGDEIDLTLQHGGGFLGTYSIGTRGGDDRVAIAGVAEGLVISKFNLGSGNDHAHLRGLFVSDRIVWQGGDGSDTIEGAANGGIYDFGTGNDEFFASGGRDQIRITARFDAGVHHTLNDWTLGTDQIRFDAELWDAVAQVFGYRGDGNTGVSAQDNWYVADDKSYSISTFLQDFLPRIETPAVSFWATFFNEAPGAVEFWYVPNSNEPFTSFQIIEIPNKQLSDLSQIQVDGPPSILDLQTFGFNF